MILLFKKKIAEAVPFLFTFIVSFITWIIFSGRFDFTHLFLGFCSCLIVVYTSGNFLIEKANINRLHIEWYRFIKYVPWLLYQVLLANFHLLYLSFHPRIKNVIDPEIFYFDTKLTRNMSLLVLANSITLTPGTITIYMSIYGKCTVHAIDKKSSESILKMETKIAKIFEEK